MKRLVPVFTAVVMILGLSACTKDDKQKEEITSSQSQNSGEETNVDANALLMAIRESQVGFPEYTNASSHDDKGKEIDGWDEIFSLSLYGDFDTEKVSSYAIAYSTAQTSDEITVVVLKAERDCAEMKKQMKDRVSDRITLFETYGPEEVSKLEKATVISKGNVCALIICDEPEKAKEAFKNFFE